MVVLFRCCGSLFVGHCRSDQLVERYDEFAIDMECNSSYLLHLGMDGPNANLKFQNDLKTHFKEFYYNPLHVYPPQGGYIVQKGSSPITNQYS